jgi:hypothetical protein
MFDFPLPPLITGGYPFTFEGDAVHWDVPNSSDSSDFCLIKTIPWWGQYSSGY